jgi:hypothetical protein
VGYVFGALLLHFVAVVMRCVTAQADASGNRVELCERLRSLTSGEPLCCPKSARGVSCSPQSPLLTASDMPMTCSCAEAGIQCHPQVCRCCEFKSEKPGCANPAGKAVYDASAVRTFRADVLSVTRSPTFMPSPLSCPASVALSDITDFSLTPAVRRASAGAC